MRTGECNAFHDFAVLSASVLRKYLLRFNVFFSTEFITNINVPEVGRNRIKLEVRKNYRYGNYFMLTDICFLGWITFVDCRV